MPKYPSNKIIFRGYDYNIDNTDIICISDFLLDKYKNYKINWTLSSTKYNAENIYFELFNYILNNKHYKKIIFTGTSAGGYPSIKFASYFHTNALVSNAQLYLEKYIHFKQLISILEQNNDTLLYNNKDIEKLLIQHKPKKIILYQNKLDSTHYKALLEFLDFVKNQSLESFFDFRLFEYKGLIPEGKTHHHINFPDNQKYYDVLIQELKNYN